MNYSQFWLSILNADLKGIQNYADKLGVGQLYGLFACMVAGRSWSSITKGIDKAEKTRAEVLECNMQMIGLSEHLGLPLKIVYLLDY